MSDTIIKSALLNEDIDHLIASILLNDSPRSLLNFALISRSCNRIAKPYIYWEITLDDEEPGTEKLWSQLFDASEQSPARHVRHLRLKDIHQRLADLQNLVENLPLLSSLSWESSAPMPGSLLAKLQDKFPNLRINVKTTKRNRMPIDTTLVSAPQLVSLDYKLYCEYIHSLQGGADRHSEYRQLTKLLMQTPKLRTLRLEISDDRRWGMDRDSVPDIPSIPENYGPLHLDLRPSSRLPPLEELKLAIVCGGEELYSFTQQHCAVWKQCMNWSKLRRLDFGGSCPTIFFTEFAGLLPSLKSFRFGFPTDWVGQNTNWAPEPACNFIDSIDGLESLEVSNGIQSLEKLWDAILKHKETLHTLNLSIGKSPWPKLGALTIDHIKQLSKFPQLRHLGLPVSGWKPTGMLTHVYEPDPKFISAICKLHRLRTLELYLHDPSEASVFSAAYNQDVYGSVPMVRLDVNGVKKFAIDVMEQSRKKGSRLELMDIHVTKTGYEDRCQPFRLKADLKILRSERADADSLSDADKYEIVGDGGWHADGN